MSLFNPAGMGKTPAPVAPAAGKGLNFTPEQIERMKKDGLWDGPPSSAQQPQDYTRDKNNAALMALFASFVKHQYAGGWSPTKKGIVPREKAGVMPVGTPMKGGGVYKGPGVGGQGIMS